jgi:hypothetical protein
MQNQDATPRTFAITIALLIVQLLSWSKPAPNRVAIQHIMQQHPVAQLIQQVHPPAPAEPIVVRLDVPTPAANPEVAFSQASGETTPIRQGDRGTQIVILAPAP